MIAVKVRVAGDLVHLDNPSSHCYAATLHRCTDSAEIGVVNGSGQIMHMCSTHAKKALRQYDLALLEKNTT